VADILTLPAGGASGATAEMNARFPAPAAHVPGPRQLIGGKVLRQLFVLLRGTYPGPAVDHAVFEADRKNDTGQENHT
jgi:hypothetical protein